MRVGASRSGSDQEFSRLARRSVRPRSYAGREPAGRADDGVDWLDYSKGSHSGWTRSSASSHSIPTAAAVPFQITPKVA